MNVDGYLARIGLDHRPPPTLEGLRAVHAAHLLAIPYENLDVQLGRPVTIERPAIYDKIVGRRRGGWCYEMNGILGWALGELGFRVTRATGAVMRVLGHDTSVANHLVLRVDLDVEGTYLADVGFGDGPRDPIRVVPGEFESNGFRFGLERADGEWWRLINHPNGGAPSFDFHLAPADEARFAARCAELQTDPNSHFMLNLFCFKHRPRDILMLRGRVLRTLRPDGFDDRLLESAEDLVTTLRDDFTLDVPQIASVWPKVCKRHAEVLAQAGP